MKKNQISVLATTKRLLYHYCSKVLESPNFVSEQTNDLAYAIIYLVNRYDEEFQRENWEELYDDFGELFDEIECDSFDVDIHKAPLWCSWSVITNDFYGVDKVLYYALRVNDDCIRMKFLNYAYLVIPKVHFSRLTRHLEWSCSEGKSFTEAVLNLFMISKGYLPDKLAVLNELYRNPDCRRFPQILKMIEPYLNGDFIPNMFSEVDQRATNTILDYVLFRDLTMTAQLEIDLSERTD